jgi:hypothetical protein
MITHVIGVAIRRFYKVYVDDENGTMTSAEAKQQAMKQIEKDGEAALTEDMNEVEPQDILALRYDYPII